VTVGHESPLPLDQAARVQMFHATTLAIAPGDMVRITHNGQIADRKHRLNNGSLHLVNTKGRVLS